MPTDWINPCGVAYRAYEDGSFELQTLGMPAYPTSGPASLVLARIWEDYGATIAEAAKNLGVPASWIVGIIYVESRGKPRVGAPCNEICSAYWKKGLCKSQGGPISMCAGGLMAFTASTADSYGHTIDWYMDHPHEMIFDGADLLINKKHSSAGILGSVKAYNGGNPCSGMRDPSDMTPGIMNMYGQGNYIETYIRACNTFVAMNLSAPPPAPVPAPGVSAARSVAYAGLAIAAAGLAVLAARRAWPAAPRRANA